MAWFIAIYKKSRRKVTNINRLTWNRFCNTTVTVTADDYDTTSGIGYTTATNYAS